MTETDPSYDAIVGPYAAAFNGYVRDELDLPQRPALRADLVERAPLVVQGLRGPAGGRVTEPRAGDAAEPAPQACTSPTAATTGRRRTSRPQDVVAHLRIPAVAQGEHRARLLRRRPHDVRPRAVPRSDRAPTSPTSWCAPAPGRRSGLERSEFRPLKPGPSAISCSPGGSAPRCRRSRGTDR